MKTIFQVASLFEQKLKKQASSNYPESESVQPIVERVVDSLRSSNKELLGSVKNISKVDVQTNIENGCLVYFQLIVEPQKYTYLIEEPQKSNTTNVLKAPIENALKAKFPVFDFRVKIGIVS